METSFKKQTRINKSLKNIDLKALNKKAQGLSPMIKSIKQSQVYGHGFVITVGHRKFLMDGDCDTNPKHNYEISTINPKDVTDTISFCTGSTPINSLNNLVKKLRNHSKK